MLAEPLEREAARAVGAALVRLGYATPADLRATLRVLARTLVQEVVATRQRALSERLVDVLAEIAGGFAAEVLLANEAKESAARASLTALQTSTDSALAEAAALSERLQRVERERQAVEVALSRREASLETAQRIAHLGSWDSDLTTGVTQWSAELCRLLGYAAGAIEPSRDVLIQAIHPDDVQMVMRALDDTITGKSSSPSEFPTAGLEFRTAGLDGVERILQAAGEVLLNAVGEPQRFIGTALDVTEHKQAEEAAALARALAHDADVRQLQDTVLRGRESEARVRQESDRLLALHRASTAVSAQGADAKVFELILHSAVELAGASSGSLYRWDADAGVLRCVVNWRVPSRDTTPDCRPGEGVAGRTFAAGGPLIINNYPSWEHAMQTGRESRL